MLNQLHKLLPSVIVFTCLLVVNDLFLMAPPMNDGHRAVGDCTPPGHENHFISEILYAAIFHGSSGDGWTPCRRGLLPLDYENHLTSEISHGNFVFFLSLTVTDFERQKEEEDPDVPALCPGCPGSRCRFVPCTVAILSNKTH